jgi:hypothetical protein
VRWDDFDVSVLANTTLVLGGAGGTQTLGPASSIAQTTLDSTYSIVSATVQNFGEVDIGGSGNQATGRLVISQNARFENYGPIDVDGSLLVQGGGDGAFVNNGTVAVQRGIAQFSRVETGTQSGSFVIGENAALAFNGNAGNASVSFEPGKNGTLIIGTPVNANTVRTVIGFDAGDAIQVPGQGTIAQWQQAPAGGGAASGTLTIAGAGGVVANINLTGAYDPASFNAEPNNSGLITITTTKAGDITVVGGDGASGNSGEGPGGGGGGTVRSVIDPVLDLSDYGRRDASAVTPNAPNDITIQLHDVTIRDTALQRIDFMDGSLVFNGASPEGRYTADLEASQIARMYYTVLGRGPEFAGAHYWVETVMEGQNRNINQVAPEFYTSREFKARYGEGTGDTQFVTLLYQNILGRDPTGDPGLNFWLGRLSSGAARPDIVVGISESQEHKDLRFNDIEANGIKFLDQPFL